MAVDISRILFNALENYAGVQLKQGAVLLDSDFNELCAIVDRRIRAVASDILGRSTVSATTPDAFKITVSGNTLQIGTGRFYVDGLLAENHGAVDPARKLFDGLMAEAAFPDAVPYDAQPYLPNAPDLPGGGRHLVYLDVWDREVTHLEQPALVEVGVGVETSARRQIVWQVRVFTLDQGQATCATPDAELEGWGAHIAPSGGRVTTGTFDVPPAEDPCELPPTGGFRGLENQTYRVEIHDAGQPGAGATFKWSRDNASVGSRVASMISAAELQLDSLGRDDVLRFNTGDWVEIIDDVREMAQKCGEMRRITSIDEAAVRIEFAAPLPSDMTPATFPESAFPRERNLIVRKWSHHKVLAVAADGTTSVFSDVDAGTTGVIPVPAAGPLLLEHGVTVTFSTSGAAGFRAGDYWVFAGRTADASLERLDNEPPRGIHHHYARLAIWDVAGGAVTDCRTHWPPPAGTGAGGETCACTVCVSTEDHAGGHLTIQQAIDQVIAAGGGTVCLEAGNYQLRAPVVIEGARSVTLAGQGSASRLIPVGDTGAVLVNKSQDVLLESFSVLCRGSVTAPQDAVTIASSRGVCLERLDITVESENPQWAAIGLAEALMDIRLRDNSLTAPTGIRSGSVTGSAGLADVRIENNDFECQATAVLFASVSVHQLVNRICGNRVNGCVEGGFFLTGLAVPGFGIEVQGNVFNVLGHGIVAGISGLRVLDNDILQAKEATPKDQRGILIVPGASGSGPLVDCQMIGNRIQGFHGSGIFVRAPIGTVMINQNQIARGGVGVVLTSDGVLDQLTIENNQFKDMTGSAILAKGEGARYAATGNQIRTRSQEPSVLLEFVRGEGVFSHNECHREGDGGAPDVRLQATTLIVGSNRVIGGDISIEIRAARDHYTVLGNICRGKIQVELGASLAAPWAPLNLEGVS